MRSAAYYGFCDASAALSLRKLNSPFQGHPHVLRPALGGNQHRLAGPGFSVALGMALGLKLQKQSRRASTRCWATANCRKAKCGRPRCARRITSSTISAPSIDYNKLQSDDSNDNIMRLEPLAAKWRAFDWAVAEIDGHDIWRRFCRRLRRAGATQGRPAIIIAHTIKGKGVPYMENMPHWHGSVKLTRDQAEEALDARWAPRTKKSRSCSMSARLKHPP